MAQFTDVRRLMPRSRRRSLARAAARISLPFLAITLLSARARAQEIDCDKGDIEVRSLGFLGNRTFNADQLSARVLATPSSFAKRYFKIFGTKRCYPSDGLGPDVLRLKQFYENNGFYDTKVDTVVRPVSRSAVAVTFRIDEGQPLTLDTLEITGLDSVANRPAVTRDLQLKQGGRFGRLQMYTDIDSMVARLRNSGYPSASVLREYTTHRAEHLAEVHLDVTPGPLAHFGTIAVSSLNVNGGPSDIDSSVVLGLLGFRQGDRYSDRALLDAQRNLYNLGAYRHVGVELDSASLGDSVANVRVDLREDYMRQFDLQEGWATLDCMRINAQYTNKNFLDQAKRIELTGRMSKLGYAFPRNAPAIRNLCYRPYLDQDSTFSSKLNYYTGATFRQPTLFGTHWVPAYTAYTERHGEYRAYLRTTFIGADASATRNIGFGMPLRVGYTLEFGRTEAEPATLCAIFSRCDNQSQAEFKRNLRLAVASVALQRIRTDNLIEPRRGYVLAGELRGAAPTIGSDPSQKFGKATTDASWYHALTARTVIALRARSGFIAAPRDTSGARLPPPQERLYAGGANSVRGFQQNELGPVVYLVDQNQFAIDTLTDSTRIYALKPSARESRTIPVGGSTVLVLNAELRIRDPFLPDLLEYVPFIDGGQVWTRAGNVQGFSVKNLVVTPGLGIKLFSPIGPIQLNLGYNSHPNLPGPAYFAAPVDVLGRAPLICVTPPGAPPVPVTIHKDGQVEQGQCPASFSPPRSSNFLSRIVPTLSIGANF
ncbi:MAG TPA: BamA/TamA family outer membrane protein [Gemmatimonadaceae bacterium]|nr:BamA/TamA family outer membrane protein [Gemmatimonadaceae bacterium]